ncbi:DMT family transporter [Streptacidiphilus cavernicola]|uniref:DMT family transporter n=1 Tax=Streptacidiphilus cavernicola TaxID=3342716 RepID=A0ABV6VZI4_9ACTN
MQTTQPRPRLWLIDLPVLVVAAIWGSSYLSVKTIATGPTVVPLLVLRFLVALLPMGVLVAGRLRRLSRPEVRGGMLIGLILATIFLVETVGVVHTSATNAGLIISLTMVFTPLLESGLARTRPSTPFVCAAAISVLGVALLTQGAGFQRPGLGDLLVFCVAVIRAVHVVVMHRMKSLRDTESGALTFVQLGTCLVVFLLISPFSGPAPWRLAASYDAGQWVDLLYLGLACTVFAFFVQMWAVRRTSPSRVSLLLGTEPLWAAVIGVEIGGDKLGALGAVGAVLVLVGTTWGRATAGRGGGAVAADGDGGVGAGGTGDGTGRGRTPGAPPRTPPRRSMRTFNT